MTNLARELALKSDFSILLKRRNFDNFTLSLEEEYSERCLVRIVGVGIFSGSSYSAYIVNATISKITVVTEYNGQLLEQTYDRITGIREGQEGQSRSGFRLDLNSIDPYFTLGLAEKQHSNEEKNERRILRNMQWKKGNQAIFLHIKGTQGEPLFQSSFDTPRQARKFLRHQGLSSKQASKETVNGGVQWTIEVQTWDSKKAEEFV